MAANISPLAVRLADYLKENKITIDGFSKEIGYSRSAVSLYLSGKYSSDTTEIEGKISEYFKGNTDMIPLMEKPIISENKRPEFFESADAVSIIGLCKSCQEYKGLGILIGRSGYGKTYTLKQYGKLKRVAYVECDDSMGAKDFLESIERELGLPTTYASIWKRINNIREFFKVNKGYLLIVDEADKLISKHTQKKMEILRSIYDQSACGIVIAGEPKLEAMIKAYLTRFANRIDFFYKMDGLTGKEVMSYLKDIAIDDKALAELKYRASNPQNGCFRLFDRTLNNVFRVISESGKNRITVDEITQASAMMML